MSMTIVKFVRTTSSYAHFELEARNGYLPSHRADQLALQSCTSTTLLVNSSSIVFALQMTTHYCNETLILLIKRLIHSSNHELDQP